MLGFLLVTKAGRQAGRQSRRAVKVERVGERKERGGIVDY